MRLFIDTFLKSGAPGEEKRNQVSRQKNLKIIGLVVIVVVFHTKSPRINSPRTLFF